ncbi:MAG: hypothetical protein EOP10_00060 [Proteobacteria bacterium]|nr:MAG: hypothetical protein EOP10_00060 [Pseudomonadota bacterium]
MFKSLYLFLITLIVNACRSVAEPSDTKSLSDLGGVPNLLKKIPVIPETLSDNLNELDKSREEYQYSDTKIPGVSILNNLPDAQGPDNEWSLLVLIKLRKIRENTLSFYDNVQTWYNKKYPERNERFVFQYVPEYKNALETVKLIAIKNFDSIIRFYLVKTGYINQGKGGMVNQISDYDLVFPVLPKPSVQDIVTNDDKFANAYVAGLNPMLIEGVSDLKNQFRALDNAAFRKINGFQNDTLEAALREKRLYMADLSFMGQTIAGRQNPSREKFVYGPKSYFAVPKGESSIKPVGITIDDIKAPGIVLPQDGAMWTIAKTIMNSATANHHEIFAHLGQTHLVIDPIAVACYRHISANHPLSRLMRPHFHGTMFINSLAVTLLAKEGEVVDLALWGSSENNRKAIPDSVQQHSLNDLVIPSRMAARKIDNLSGLPNCPYRDDSLLLWTAMSKWVSSYVDIYYAQDENVKKDQELALWVREIQSPFALQVTRRDRSMIVEEQRNQPGGNLKPFGKNGAIETKDDLVSFLTVVMFTASAQHASVNFPQTDMMHTPNYPLSLSGKLPAPGSATEKDWLNMLPTLDMATLQAEFLGFLGQIYYTKLGGYPTFQFAVDSRVHPAFNNYRKELLNIETTINERNRDTKLRPHSYTHLLPSKIPMSINI